MGPKAVEQRPIRLDVEVSCRGCARAVPVDGMFLRTSCGSCGAPVELTAPIWIALMREIDEKSFALDETSPGTERSEQSIPAGRLAASWRHSKLSCPGCQRALTLVEPGTDEMIECGACGTKLDTFPAPPWLRTELPTAMQLYGALRQPDPERAERGFWMTFQGTPPALGDQRRQVIEAAIGPGPTSLAVPITPQKKGMRWEWLAIGVFALAIAAAVRQCSKNVDSQPRIDDGSEVEPSGK